MELIVPFDEFQKSEYHKDCIKPQKIQRQNGSLYQHNRLKSIICTHESKEIA